MAAKVDAQILKRILELKSIGLTNQVIGERLGICKRTVQFYVNKKAEG